MLNVNKNNKDEKRKFGIRDKIGYFFGDMGGDGFFDIAGSFLMVYYTDVFGINPALAGSIFLFARIWDAFMDVIAGRFIDRRPVAKKGKYMPWILRFSPIYFIACIILFTKIPGLSNTGYFIYALVTYCIWGSCFSFLTIPYGSSASAITGDQIERASLSTSRSTGANIMQMATKTFIPLVAFIKNKPDANRFLLVSFVMAILGFVCYIIYYNLCTERVVVNKKSVEKKVNMFTSIKGMGKNRPFISIVSAALVLQIATFVSSSLNTYMYKDYFQDTKAMALSGTILILNVIFIAPIVSPLCKKIGKKEVISVALLYTAIAYFLLFLIPIKNPYVFTVFNFLANIGFVLFNFVNWAFIAEVGDYHAVTTGKREDGTVFSFYTFSRKLGQSFAGVVGGIALSMAGYVNGPHQTAEVALKIKNLAVLIPSILYFIMFLIMTFGYTLTKDRLVKLKSDLETKVIS